MATNKQYSEVQIDAQGRVVIPAGLRKTLNLKPGDRLVARQEGERLVLECRETIEKQLQDRFRHIPRQVSLVDELIAERRAEAARRPPKRRKSDIGSGCISLAGVSPR